MIDGALYFTAYVAIYKLYKYVNLDLKTNVIQNQNTDNHQTLIGSYTSNSTYTNLIGNTPLIHLRKLSKILNCDIYVKMESMNPSNTGKDRAVAYMLHQAQFHPNYKDHVDIVEGTSGSTGIALAFQCHALGLRLNIVMPDDQASEKKTLLEKLGAKVWITPSCSITNKNHYVNIARQLALDLEGIFIDQFENKANYLAHYESTGPEIWDQMKGEITAFVMSAGTGGTIAGVSRYFKEKNSAIKVILADPTGSSLLHKVKYDVCYTVQQSERTIRRHRYDSVIEGVGLDRVTQNFEVALIDDAYLITDQVALETAHWLVRNEGLFVGSSSALNVAAAVYTAKQLVTNNNKINDTNDDNNYKSSSSSKLRPKVVTIICDHGSRHLSRFWDPDYIAINYKLTWPPPNTDFIPSFFFD